MAPVCVLHMKALELQEKSEDVKQRQQAILDARKAAVFAGKEEVKLEESDYAPKGEQVVQSSVDQAEI